MSDIDPIYRELAEGLGAGSSRYIPRILSKLASLEQARIIRELPAALEEIAQKLQMDRVTVDRHLQELYEKGLVMPTRKGPRMARSIQQLHDTTASNPRFEDVLGEEFFDLWLACRDEEMADTTVEESFGGEYPRWRCIPRWQSIKDIPGVMPWEDVREILREQETIAQVLCPCKRVSRHRECGVPDDICINVGRAAEYNINRGAGEPLTVEEALQVIDRADDHPVVHLTVNQRAVNQLICNCHWCCCSVLNPLFRQSRYRIEQGFARSRFEAAVEPEKCTACETCLDRCQFGAIEMKDYPGLDEPRASIDADRCMGCGCCVIACSGDALSMRLVRPPEHVPEASGGAW